MWRYLANELRELWRASGARSAYRPDLHYMRGPGPRWHAKFDGLVTQTPRPPSRRPLTDHHQGIASSSVDCARSRPYFEIPTK